jgi:predicted nucleic acid-binding protein
VNILLDTNIILGVLLQRTTWVTQATRIWTECKDGRLRVFVSSSSITDIYYITRKLAGALQARKAIEDCLAVFQIMEFGREHLLDALNRNGKNFEDDLQIILAQKFALDAIITRDKSDFAVAVVPVLTPAELIARLATSDQEAPPAS